MPTYACHINKIDFITIRLFGRLSNTNAKLFHQSFFSYFLPKLLSIVNFDMDHEVFGKCFIVILLQYEFAAVTFKAYIISSIPVYFESQFLEKLFSSFKITPRWNEWFNG